MDSLRYIAAGLDAFEEVGNDSTYRKELIYTGKFYKKDKQSFEVTEHTIDGWCDTGNLMLSRGVEIPFPEEHTSSPNAKLGNIIRFSKGTDSKGKKSLYGYVKFADKKSAEIALKNNVSINADALAYDGLGNKYDWAITHVASTSYPVIPALGPFQAIAASLIDGDEEMADTKVTNPTPKKLTLDEWLKKLDVEVPDGTDEEGKKKLLQQAISQGVGQIINIQEGKAEAKPDSKTKTKSQKIAASNVSPMIVKQVLKARKTELEQLVRDSKISPAVRDKLADKYCKEETLSLSLSNNSEDDFDTTIEALSLNEPNIKGEKTGGQSVSLSNTLDPAQNPLLADAQNRAKQFNK